MTNAGIPVPAFYRNGPGVFRFIEKAQLQDKIKTLLDPVDSMTASSSRKLP
jgi:hypothetical protein